MEGCNATVSVDEHEVPVTLQFPLEFLFPTNYKPEHIFQSSIMRFFEAETLLRKTIMESMGIPSHILQQRTIESK